LNTDKIPAKKGKNDHELPQFHLTLRHLTPSQQDRCPCKTAIVSVSVPMQTGLRDKLVNFALSLQPMAETRSKTVDSFEKQGRREHLTCLPHF
jgi:hypothetical protein